MRHSEILTVALVTGATAYNLPNNLKQIYDKHKRKCSKVLAKGCTKGDVSQRGESFSYCGNIPGSIFISSSKGYTNIDIECDGVNNSAGKCANDPSGHGETARRGGFFKSDVKKFDISDLDANIHPYVVFGNEDHSPKFKPQSHGMQPLSVMAVGCNGQLHYGIWGDTDRGVSTGGASISLAGLCFPNEHLDGNHGHDPNDVRFMGGGFTSKDAVPGATANWKGKNAKEFEDSIKSIGDKLVAGLKA
uniref:Endo-chitosanase n=1 Tax=Aspergillus oryzae TaxID=5062 RepID=A0A6C0NH67_ASPOZ|nr:chitosanase [Aspergillus oryzae]